MRTSDLAAGAFVATGVALATDAGFVTGTGALVVAGTGLTIGASFAAEVALATGVAALAATGTGLATGAGFAAGVGVLAATGAAAFREGAVLLILVVLAAGFWGLPGLFDFIERRMRRGSAVKLPGAQYDRRLRPAQMICSPTVALGGLPGICLGPVLADRDRPGRSVGRLAQHIFWLLDSYLLSITSTARERSQTLPVKALTMPCVHIRSDIDRKRSAFRGPSPRRPVISVNLLLARRANSLLARSLQGGVGQ